MSVLTTRRLERTAVNTNISRVRTAMIMDNVLLLKKFTVTYPPVIYFLCLILYHLCMFLGIVFYPVLRFLYKKYNTDRHSLCKTGKAGEPEFLFTVFPSI